MAEPVTTLTDLLVAALAWWWAWRLRQSGSEAQLSRSLWAWGLAVQGTAAFLGGIYHGFFFNSAYAESLWRGTLILLSAASTLLVSGLSVAVLPWGAVCWVFVALSLKFFAYVSWIWPRKDFLPALCDQALALILLAALSLAGWRTQRPAVQLVLTGLTAFFAAALIQHFRLGVHQHFNHNDIYHLFGGLALWFFYRAGRLLRDTVREEQSKANPA